MACSPVLQFSMWLTQNMNIKWVAWNAKEAKNETTEIYKLDLDRSLWGHLTLCFRGKTAIIQRCFSKALYNLTFTVWACGRETSVLNRTKHFDLLSWWKKLPGLLLVALEWYSHQGALQAAESSWQQLWGDILKKYYLVYEYTLFISKRLVFLLWMSPDIIQHVSGVSVFITEQVPWPVGQSPKNIPLRDTGEWTEDTKAGGDRGWWLLMVLCVWLMVSERKGVGMGVSPQSANRGMECLSMA